MISAFYHSYSRRLLCLAALLFPFLYYEAETLPSNNDIETWLPSDSEVRSRYERFKREFGAEEVILVALSGYSPDDPLVEALCGRIANLEGIRSCFSPGRLRKLMKELGVPEKEISRRLKGLAVSGDGSLIGLMAQLSPQGLQDRAGTVAEVRRQLDYCQLEGKEVSLAGAPVVIAELDRLGSRSKNKKFFLVTLVICLGLLYISVRQWKLTLALLGLTIWAIQFTLAAVKWGGGETNFIMNALSVMVMVFTLAVAIHFLHYYRTACGQPDAIGHAFRLACKPCFLATLTTAIGLVSLSVSDIAPVSQFGYAAAVGTGMALLTGLGLTPAALTLWPPRENADHPAIGFFETAAGMVLRRSRRVAVLCGGVVLFCSVGLLSVTSKIDPLDFLPDDSRVLADVQRIRRNLANVDSIEAVVDFGNRDLAFLDKLQRVRRLEDRIGQHPGIQHTLSLATFFPKQMPDSPLAVAKLLNRAKSNQQNNDFLSEGTRLWRISARIDASADFSRQDILQGLKNRTREVSVPVTFTGVAPLLECAQVKIFNGFWKSFTMAFGIITAIMILALRSLRAGMVAMVPNLTPICLVFGLLGWFGVAVDIGMMMTGSIALGIAVDGTFHYLIRYQEDYRRRQDSTRAARTALMQTAAPIFKAATITAVGMLALTLSRFTPTVRFGYMMAALMLAAVIGDLLLLPALLSLRAEKSDHRLAAPHFMRRVEAGAPAQECLSEE